MLGQRISRLRKAAGMTQEQLAAATGLKQFHISRIERGGIKDVMAETLLRIARALHVSTDYLLSGEGPAHDASDATPPPSRRRPRSKRSKPQAQE
jgi:transcriptional regulator with XRE-family HTH domain